MINNLIEKKMNYILKYLKNSNLLREVAEVSNLKKAKPSKD